ncbi:hypothetical protein LINGRAHAP2_LOCUS10009 [Linum grandiflorum]
MLLQISSIPILNSSIPHSKDQQRSPEPNSFPQIRRTSFVTLTASSSGLISSPSFPSHGDYVGKMTSALSETDLHSLLSTPVPERNMRTNGLINGLSVSETDEVEEETTSFDLGIQRVGRKIPIRMRLVDPPRGRRWSGRMRRKTGTGGGEARSLGIRF